MKVSTLIAAAGLTLAVAFGAGLAATAGTQEKTKVAYHLSEEGRVGFVLNNIRNHIKGVGGPENVDIVLVVHGPALKAFHDMQAKPTVLEQVQALRDEGVSFNACGNTMRAQGVQTDDLLPGFVRVDQGGVVRLAELQSEGYVYLRP